MTRFVEATTGFEPVNRGFADLRARVHEVGQTARMSTIRHYPALLSACGTAVGQRTIQSVTTHGAVTVAAAVPCFGMACWGDGR